MIAYRPEDVLSYFLYLEKQKSKDKKSPPKILDNTNKITLKMDIVEIDKFKEYLKRTKRSAQAKKELKEFYD